MLTCLPSCYQYGFPWYSSKDAYLEFRKEKDPYSSNKPEGLLSMTQGLGIDTLITSQLHLTRDVVRADY